MRRLALVGLIGLVGATVAAAQGGFQDDFNGPKLDPRWEWSAPKAGPTLSLTDSPGNVRVTLPRSPGGFNHWVEDTAADAPLLLAPAPGGDFSLESHLKIVSFSPDGNFHLALVVAFSKRYLVGWGPFFSPFFGTPKDQPQVWCEPTGQGHYLADPADARDVYLRIVKTGFRYAFSLRHKPQEPWQTVGQWDSSWPVQSVGFMGKTFGDGGPVVVDVDFIKLQPSATATAPAPRHATLRVDCAGPTWPLSPLRFGHFIEHLANCIEGGLWAELLRDRKFTGGVGPEGVVEGWRALLQAPGLTYAPDNVDYYCPCQSQRMTMTQAGKLFGVLQGRIGLRGGDSYKVRLVAKQRGLRTPLHIGLMQGDKPLSQIQEVSLGEDWTVHEFELTGPPRDTEGQFVLACEGPGTVWIGAASLMPADNVEGMRAEVLAAIREIRPGVVRWPGGNFTSQNDWRDSIGPRDKRAPRWNRAWNQWEPSDFGTDEFLRFCELVGCEPYICVNCGEGNWREAAAWVEYCNGPADSPWGKVRAANGHPAPYGVKIWGLGNEMYGDWQAGHLTATRYALKALEFARAMRAVDPGIKLVGVGVEGDGWGNWNREVCRILGRELDWLSVHYYLGLGNDVGPMDAYMRAMGAPGHVERMLGEAYALGQQGAGKGIPLAFDEWNVWRPGAEYTLREGLFAAGIFNALNRLGPRVPMANMALLVNVLGVIHAGPQTVFRTPTHQAFSLYANHSGPLGVAVRAQAPPLSLPGGAISALDASASLSADKKTLYLAVVNRLPTEALPTTLDLAGLTPTDVVHVLTLTAATPETLNTYQKTDTVKLTERTLPLAEALQYAFPAHSATVMEFVAR